MNNNSVKSQMKALERKRIIGLIDDQTYDEEMDRLIQEANRTNREPNKEINQ